MIRPTPRYVVRPGSKLFDRCVVDTLTDRIVWGPARDMRKAERVAAKLNGGSAGRADDTAAISPPAPPIQK